MEFDLTNLTTAQVITLTAVIAAIDVVTAMVAAAIQKKFSLAFVAEWLISHVAKRVTPIYALIVLGHGIGPLGLPVIPALGTMAIAGVAGYLGETIKSIIANFSDTPTPTGDESSIPPSA